ncbi:MAG: hypothetical protein NTW49_06575 [Bacteroidia bacterium]|nr:hypothetical protein [Bacteroidia bacterium]
MKVLNNFCKCLHIPALVSLMIFLWQCLNAQNNESGKPKKNIKVNKKYDEKGNLIYYDSTYSYSSSGEAPQVFFHDTLITGDFGDFGNIFPDFHFNFSFPGINSNDPFGDLDSLFFKDPFHNNLMFPQWQLGDSIMNDMLKKLQAVPFDTLAAPSQNNYIQPAIPAKPRKKNDGKSITL